MAKRCRKWLLVSASLRGTGPLVGVSMTCRAVAGHSLEHGLRTMRRLQL